jgi:hypothetical protein
MSELIKVMERLAVVEAELAATKKPEFKRTKPQYDKSLEKLIKVREELHKKNKWC